MYKAFEEREAMNVRRLREELQEARVLGEMNRRQFLDHLGKVARES